jgi:hypothetical protein
MIRCIAASAFIFEMLEMSICSDADTEGLVVSGVRVVTDVHLVTGVVTLVLLNSTHRAFALSLQVSLGVFNSNAYKVS